MTPLVSVIISNYNYGRYVGEAIESALAQTHRPIEIIVVDDGSTDHSGDVIARHSDQIMPIFKPNGGQASAVNAGFEQSHGQIVCFLDSDDRLLPTAMEKAATAFDEDVAQVHWPLWEIDAAGRRSGRILPDDRQQSQGQLRDLTIRSGPVVQITATSGNAWHRSFLTKILPVPQVDQGIYADVYLATLAPLFGRLVLLPEPLTEYRRHGSNEYSALSFAAKMDTDLEIFLQRCHLLSRHLAAEQINASDESWTGDSDGYYKWLRRSREALQKLSALIPRGETFVLVDENEWGTSEVLEGRVAVPFLEHEGEYWGTPATDEIALRELKRLRDEGAGFLVMTWPAFWWPEHYPQFTGEVRRRFPCLYEGDDLVVYDLRD